MPIVHAPVLAMIYFQDMGFLVKVKIWFCMYLEIYFDFSLQMLMNVILDSVIAILFVRTPMALLSALAVKDSVEMDSFVKVSSFSTHAVYINIDSYFRYQ